MSYASWGNSLYSGKRSYNIIGARKQLIGAGLGLIVLSLLLIGILGLQKSIDFKGGTEVTIPNVAAAQAPANQAVAALAEVKNAKVTSLGTDSVRIQTDTLSAETVKKFQAELAKVYKIDQKEIAVTTIGPSWGSDVTNKAIQSLVIFFILVGLMLTLYFRTWTMPVAALFALCHDVLITGAVLAVTRVEISPATIIGVLTILGYSLYDTVVVFDKVRELTDDYTTQSRNTYGELVNLAVNQTLVRSINTSVVALLPVLAILSISSVLLGGGTLRDISAALAVGMIAGTASSIFIAPTVLVALRSRHHKVAGHTQKVMKVRAKALELDKNLDELSEEELAKVAHPIRAGAHLGRSAQPTRKPRSKR